MPDAKKLVTELELLEGSHPLTYKARMSLFFLRAMVAEKEGRYADAMQQYEQANAIWKKNELKLGESYSNLRMILSNYLACAHYAERFDVYPAIIDQIENLPIENISDEADTFLVAKGARLLYVLNNPAKTNSEKLIFEIEQGLKKFHLQLPRHQMIYLRTNVCMLHFQVQNYSSLVDALNNTYAVIGRDEKMKLLLSELKFLEIMTHFSLKNYDLLDYQLRNTDRWLHEHELNEPFSDILLKTFPTMRTKSQFLAIKDELQTIECSPNFQAVKALVLEWMQNNIPINFAKTLNGKSSANRSAQPNQ
jgi:hypothetical protein